MKKLISSCIIIGLILTSTLPALGSKLSEAREEKENIDSQINKVNNEKKKVTNELKSKIEEKQYVDNVKQQEEERERQRQAEIKRVSTEIESIDQKIKEYEEEYQKKQELLRTRLKVIYENSNSSFFETLIESKNITDFFSRLELLSVIKKKDEELIKSLYEGRTLTEYKKTEKLTEKQEKLTQLRNLQNKINNLKVSRANIDGEIQDFSKRLTELEAKEDSLIKQSEELVKQIRSLEKKGTKYAGGIMLWPTPSTTEISSYYGYRIHPIFKKRKMHTGIDINAASGASIVAANSGTVILASWQGGYGNAVIIDHGGGITTLYGHCSRMLVSVGDKVKRGEVIAKVGSTGWSTGPHLHFEVRKNGSTVNPLSYFNK